MTEHNIFQEIQDDMERQKLEALWKRYGIWVLAMAVALVAGTGGYSAWNSWQAGQYQTSTAALIHVVKSAETDETKQISALQDFAENNPGTAQSALAQLRAADLAVKNGKLAEGIKIYDALAKNSSIDPALRQLADVLSVRSQLDSAPPADLLKRLEPLAQEKAPWRLTALEYTGYLALKTGDKAKAKQIFTDLSQNTAAPKAVGERAADMLRFVSE
jgi:hypothetical protein